MLKTKTIVRAFEKRGWEKMNIGPEGSPKVWLISQDRGTSSRIFAEIEGNYIKLTDARHVNYCNVHIDSYWSPFSLKDLKESLDKIEKIYSELCGTHFERRINDTNNL